MKILITRSSDGTIGGAEMSARDQVVALTKLGHEACLLTSASAESLNISPNLIKKTWFLQKGSAPLRYLRYLVLLPLKLMKDLVAVFSYKPDIINPHSREEQIFLTLTKWLHRKPVVWKDPGDLTFQLKTKRSNPLAKIYQRLLMHCINKADGIYTLNPEDREYICKISNCKKDKIYNIPSSILFSDYSVERKRKVDTKKTLIGYVGRLSKDKSVSDLISAFNNIDNGNTELWIVGDGPERSSLEKQAKKNIKFIGYTTNLSKYFNQLDIFVQPARIEGWGRTIKESMHFSLPIVGSNTGGIAQQIDHEKTGLLFKTNNIKDLEEKLRILITDKQLRVKLAKTAKKKSDKDGDFVNIVEKQILPIYEKALS